MKYLFVIIAFISLALTACGEQRSEPNAAKESKAAAEKISPQAEKVKELQEESYPADTEDPKITHAK